MIAELAEYVTRKLFVSTYLKVSWSVVPVNAVVAGMRPARQCKGVLVITHMAGTSLSTITVHRYVDQIPGYPRRAGSRL